MLSEKHLRWMSQVLPLTALDLYIFSVNDNNDIIITVIIINITARLNGGTFEFKAVEIRKNNSKQNESVMFPVVAW